MPRRHNVKNQFEQLHHPRSFPYYLCISWQRNARTRQRVGEHSSPAGTASSETTGAGNQLFVRIACGLLIPDRGVVSPRLVSAYCAQEAGVEPPCSSICVRLRPGDHAPREGCSASPRYALAFFRALRWRAEENSNSRRALAESRSLAMDEPTNHVDAECRRQICKALAEYKGIGLLVSHDRALLDSLAKDCLCFESGHVTMRPATTPKLARRRIWSAKARRGPNRLRDPKEKRMKAEYIRRVENASRSASKRSARHVDPKDHDAKHESNSPFSLAETALRASSLRAWTPESSARAKPPSTPTMSKSATKAPCGWKRNPARAKH